MLRCMPMFETDMLAVRRVFKRTTSNLLDSEVH